MDYAEDTNAFLWQQVSEPAVIFGHSLGGMVALLVAAQCPEKIHAVVVGDSPLTAESGSKSAPNRSGHAHYLD
jgi:pimeloyl-ACP methyl ester carboxylesterase